MFYTRTVDSLSEKYRKKFEDRIKVIQRSLDESRLPALCEGCETQIIFNMDEMGLFFRNTTRSTYFKTREDCPGGKRSKDCLTVALCASFTDK